MEHIRLATGSSTHLQCPCIVSQVDLLDIPTTFEAYVNLKEHETAAVMAPQPFGEEDSFYNLFTGPTYYSRAYFGDIPRLLWKTQKYMFFAFLRVVFATAQVPVDLTHFIATDCWGNSVISTGYLREYMENFFLQAVQMNSETRRHTKYKIDVLHAHTTKWASYWEQLLRYHDPAPQGQGYVQLMQRSGSHNGLAPKAQMIMLSIDLLCEALVQLNHAALKDSDFLHLEMPRFQPHFYYVGYEQRKSRFIDQLMLESGWCPNEAALLQHRGNQRSLTSKYVASRMDRRKIGTSHEHCSRRQCVRRSMQTYEPAHLQSTCACPKMYSVGCSPALEEQLPKPLDPGQVTRTINANCVPLISLPTSHAPKELSDDRLVITSYDPRQEAPVYVAISHVWADGMGNRGGNWLPRCVVEKLQRLVNLAKSSTGDNIPLWIDTLCIPRNDIAARKRAILQMNVVYKNAAAVLVVDKGLMQIMVEDSQLDGAMMAIANSGWMRRLWTLQESTLARDIAVVCANDLLFPLGDKARLMNLVTNTFWKRMRSDMTFEAQRANAPVSRLSQILSQTPLPKYSADLLERLKYYYKEESVLAVSLDLILGAMGVDTDTIDPVLGVWRGVGPRETSESGDEAICIALLLGRPLRQIIRADPEIRMAMLLKSLKRVPALVCFFEGRRYDDERHRWIPRSFMVENGVLGANFPSMITKRHFIQGFYYAFPTSDGLRVRLPAFFLELDKDFWTRQDSEKGDPAEIFFKISEKKTFRLIATEGSKLRYHKVDSSAFSELGAAVILPLMEAYDFPESVILYAILTSVQKGREPRRRESLQLDSVENPSPDNVVRVRFEANAVVHRLPTETDLHASASSLPIQWPCRAEAGRHFLQATVMPPTQQWCLG